MFDRTTSELDDAGEAILSEILSSAAEESDNAKGVTAMRAPMGSTPTDEEDPKKPSLENHAQWALGGNDRFMPVGTTAPTLPAGVYSTFAVPGMWGVEKMNIASDGIYLLPDMATQTVLAEAEKFWSSEAKYRTHKLLYKRGIILWGPPGGGKTVAVKLLIQELVKRDGIVLVVDNVHLATLVLKAIRRIEPKRNLIVVFEDIDEIIYGQGEALVLSILDGENNVDNILHVATTNYPDRLGARIINRPSRFDRRVYVGLPGPEARRSYLAQTTNEGLTPSVLDMWVKDTDEWASIAHLRELVAAVYCLEQPYDEVIKRLKKMTEPIKTGPDGFRRRDLGFGGTSSSKIVEGPE